MHGVIVIALRGIQFAVVKYIMRAMVNNLKFKFQTFTQFYYQHAQTQGCRKEAQVFYLQAVSCHWLQDFQVLRRHEEEDRPS